jgi:hypothetical protein
MPAATAPARSPLLATPTACVAAALGAAIGLGVAVADRPDDPIAAALHLAGYPVASAIIARFVPVVRDRHARWFTAHQAAMVAICVGWAVVGSWAQVVANGLWVAAAAVWWWRAG